MSVLRGDPGWAAEQRAQFDQEHWLRLPELIHPDLLDRLQAAIEQEGFGEQTHETEHTELVIAAGPALAMLTFWANDLRLFEAVRELTGCGPIKGYFGRIYRMLPGPAHEGHWHGDVTKGRMVAMSVNLSSADYAGGMLEIRDRESQRGLARVSNMGPGDAILFRIDRALEHRVSAVEGREPKTAFAGWFVSAKASPLARPPFEGPERAGVTAGG